MPMRRKKATKRRHPGFSYPKNLEPRGARGSHDEKTATGQDAAGAVSLTERLIEQAPPTFPSFFIDEPKLVFGDGELCADPKTGISAFGPIASGLSKRVIRIGIIGTGQGIDAMRAYLYNARARIEPGLNSKGKLFDTFCFPDFPGIDKSFRVSFDTDPRIQRSIPRQVVSLVTKELGALATVEPNPDVVVIVMPPEVEEACKIIGAEFAAMKIRLTPVQKNTTQV
jgi:hypothetical protein